MGVESGWRVWRRLAVVCPEQGDDDVRWQDWIPGTGGAAEWHYECVLCHFDWWKNSLEESEIGAEE